VAEKRIIWNFLLVSHQSETAKLKQSERQMKQNEAKQAKRNKKCLAK
jgi:hypothetical protein